MAIPIGHPEERCQRCGRKNVVWSTDDDVWNRVMMKHPQTILCPRCFAHAAEKVLDAPIWRLVLAEQTPAATTAKEEQVAALVAPTCGWCLQPATLDLDQFEHGAEPVWVCVRPPCNRIVRPVRADERTLIEQLHPPPVQAPDPTEKEQDDDWDEWGGVPCDVCGGGCLYGSRHLYCKPARTSQ